MMKQGYSNLVSAAASKAAYGFVIGMMVMVFSVHAQEETTQPVASEVIGIVDMKGILQRSIAIASIRKTLDEQGAIFQSEISVEETALREAEKNLNEDKANISEDEFKKRLADFEGRVINLQQSIQAQKASFDRSYAQAQEKLEKELLIIVSDIAEERGFAVVIQRQDAVVYENGLDISNNALERLNERTKNLKITLEKKERQ